MEGPTCPICGNSLYRKPSRGMVMDGNVLYECRIGHNFWRNPRLFSIIHYDSQGVSESRFKFERCWELNDADQTWTELPKEDPKPEPAAPVENRITFTIGSTDYNTGKFRELIYKAETRAKEKGVSVAHIVGRALEDFFDTKDED